MPYPDAGVNRLSFLPQSQCPVSVQGLTDQKDWDIELAEKKGTVNPCGLYDLNRKPRPIAAAYRHLLEKFGRMALVAHGEIFAVSSAPAHPPPAVTFRSLPRRGEPCVRPLP